MINSFDRSGYFGASDTSMVIADNRQTKTWRQWWLVKLGEMESTFSGSIYTEAGNKYEHRILKAISEEITLDRQIIIEKLKLRVNYDGDLDGTIYEVKTHKAEKDFEISKQYWRQAQVEMYAYKTMEKELELPPFKKLYIVSYPLYPDEYYTHREDISIDMKRVKFNPVKYDKQFVKGEYLPKLKECARALKKGKILT